MQHVCHDAACAGLSTTADPCNMVVETKCILSEQLWLTAPTNVDQSLNLHFCPVFAKIGCDVYGHNFSVKFDSNHLEVLHGHVAHSESFGTVSFLLQVEVP